MQINVSDTALELPHRLTVACLKILSLDPPRPGSPGPLARPWLCRTGQGRTRGGRYGTGAINNPQHRADAVTASAIYQGGRMSHRTSTTAPELL
jgi:hypothetical protein